MSPKLSQLTSEAVHAAFAEFHRLGRDLFLAKYGFKPARDYFVRDPLTGDLCDSKAIVGAAFQHLPAAKPLTPDLFSGGAKTVEAQLRKLGFEIVRMSAEDGDVATPGRPQPWAAQELQLVVADYLDMLVLDLNGQRFNKAERRRRLLPLLNQRTEASIEFKRRNISAVLQGLGVPPLQGYLPASNIQRELVEEIERQIRDRADVDTSALSAVERPTHVPDEFDFEKVIASPPKREHRVMEAAPAYLRNPIKRDYFEREANNRRIGRAGEEFVVRFEQWRLAKNGLGQLADRVAHVSVTEGDGLGYDVRSFWPDGRERHLEVKTTAFGQTTPFFVSSNEERFSRDHADTFSIYRVFDFRAAPKIFELPGHISSHCNLDPVTYRASFQ
ncbi:DUF3883 domain-containing protein [Paucibacter sp. O1-1]|nr:DUF3883 domain-containing protein [Paucibacter sp. O1-1]MDA3829837.1 DUF3883 domain-containing protein [Paucibacter sp. O1-1]